ncbi:hypothetical protein [Eikenella corrodens]|jgi:hypothetical protein|uniref:hypothetical protein n=1 Tax=Eikenella corrodens TaxID=539 RepID=UPI00129B0EA4|nr:hypothetical protein [Eikenella corrodens]MDU1345714.1 hypothetical protein [Eikenella corrodens]
MIGFVVLFALFIWVIVTIFSMMLFHKICRKIFPNYRWSGIVGVFIGFMLLMGGWFVYWGIEYIQVRSYVSEMCKQSGIKIYITPEEWKQMVGGEDAWRRLGRSNRNPPDHMKDNRIVLNGEIYEIFWQENDRLSIYHHQRQDGIRYVSANQKVLYDEMSGKALMQYNYTTVGSGSLEDFMGWLKTWINNILSCEDDITWSLGKNSYFFDEDSRE